MAIFSTLVNFYSVKYFCNARIGGWAGWNFLFRKTFRLYGIKVTYEHYVCNIAHKQICKYANIHIQGSTFQARESTESKISAYIILFDKHFRQRVSFLQHTNISYASSYAAGDHLKLTGSQVSRMFKWKKFNLRLLVYVGIISMDFLAIAINELNFVILKSS